DAESSTIARHLARLGQARARDALARARLYFGGLSDAIERAGRDVVVVVEPARAPHVRDVDVVATNVVHGDAARPAGLLLRDGPCHRATPGHARAVGLDSCGAGLAVSCGLVEAPGLPRLSGATHAAREAREEQRNQRA